MLSSEGLAAVTGLPLPVFEGGFWDNEDIFSLLQEIEPSGSNSTEPDPVRFKVDERKLRRMISNRESARRSRIKKQRHLENMRNEVTRLRFMNRELADRLRGYLRGSEALCRENDRFRAETIALWRKLSDLGRVLGVCRRLQQAATSNEPNLH